MSAYTLEPIVFNNVTPGSIVSTDELGSYRNLREFGYDHEAVNHKNEE